MRSALQQRFAIAPSSPRTILLRVNFPFCECLLEAFLDTRSPAEPSTPRFSSSNPLTSHLPPGDLTAVFRLQVFYGGNVMGKMGGMGKKTLPRRSCVRIPGLRYRSSPGSVNELVRLDAVHHPQSSSGGIVPKSLIIWGKCTTRFVKWGSYFAIGRHLANQ